MDYDYDFSRCKFVSIEQRASPLPPQIVAMIGRALDSFVPDKDVMSKKWNRVIPGGLGFLMESQLESALFPNAPGIDTQALDYETSASVGEHLGEGPFS
jgi:hypothetical protein